MEVLKVENLTFNYPTCSEPTINDISFSVDKGDFVALCGDTGCGKTTLLRLLKKELAPLGELKGKITLNGRPQNELTEKQAAAEVGFVMQNPEQQIVTDKVWHELAFGLENMNVPQNVIASRIAETAVYFGIEDWFLKNTSELSGGQKQLLNLASVMVMNPDILILDEPTAQLDPIAAADFVDTLKKLNRELSLTIIIVEHRLEEIIPVCDKLLIMQNGKTLYFGAPKNAVSLAASSEKILNLMPSAVRLYHKTGGEGECPLDIREGRKFIENNFKNNIKLHDTLPYHHSNKPALEFKNVYFRYEKTVPDVLSGLNLTVYENEIFCILGGNGSGKTTTLNAAAKLIKIYSGDIKVFGKSLKSYKNESLYNGCLALLPQDVQTVFLKNTVEEELEGVTAPYDISHLYKKHPYDLSGGEQQLVALAKVLSLNPKLLLLDEPTKGLDANAKLRLAEIIKGLKKQEITVVTVTHDTEFAAVCADRCAMFFRGNIVSVGIPSEFFSQNSFYTTSVSRMTKGIFEHAVTVDDAVALCLENGKKEVNKKCL